MTGCQSATQYSDDSSHQQAVREAGLKIASGSRGTPCNHFPDHVERPASRRPSFVIDRSVLSGDMSSQSDVAPRSKSALIEDLLGLAGAAMLDTSTQDANEAAIARLLNGGSCGGGGGVPVNCADSAGNTPLIRAARAGNARTVRFLLAQTPAPAVNRQNGSGVSALHEACASASAECVRALLAVSPRSVDVQDKRGRTALMWLFIGQSNSSMTSLSVTRDDLSPSSMPSAPESGCTTLAAWACAEIVSMLLGARSSLGLRNTDGDTALILACARAGASVDSADTCIPMLLQHGTNTSSPPVLSLSSASSSSPTAPDSPALSATSSSSSLSSTTTTASASSSHLLDIHAVNSRGRSALLCACASGNLVALRQLIEHYSQKSKPSSVRRPSSLTHASLPRSDGESELADAALAQTEASSANCTLRTLIGAVDRDGRSALMLAAAFALQHASQGAGGARHSGSTAEASPSDAGGSADGQEASNEPTSDELAASNPGVAMLELLLDADCTLSALSPAAPEASPPLLSLSASSSFLASSSAATAVSISAPAPVPVPVPALPICAVDSDGRTALMHAVMGGARHCAAADHCAARMVELLSARYRSNQVCAVVSACL